jgi:toxin-antitoxin system PIN domain toxin
MILFDVNVVIYASDEDAADHERYRRWLDECLDGDAAFGAADLVLSSFVRIATNRKILAKPLTLDQAFTVTEEIRGRPNCVAVHPGARHWDIFVGLVKRANARGNLVTDAYLAALAIESGCEWISTDRDYARFPGLRWRHPLEV